MPNWRETLNEIKAFQQEHAATPQVANTAIDVIRRKYRSFGYRQTMCAAFTPKKSGLVELSI
jgi:hypothetical protein